MGIRDSVAEVLVSLAERLGFPIQRPADVQGASDYRLKGESMSVVDMMTGALTGLMLFDFSLPVDGDSERAVWLNKVADDLVNKKLTTAVQTGMNTGDCIIVPFWDGKAMNNIIVGADEFEITSSFSDRLGGVLYIVDTYTDRQKSVYTLLQSIQYQDATDAQGNTVGVNAYRLFVAKDGAIQEGLDPASVTASWARYNPEWFIPGVDRLLVGRFKSLAVDPCNPNSIKGIPTCFGSSEPIRDLRKLYRQYDAEIELSEKIIFADKSLFKTKQARRRNDDGTIITEDVNALPEGKKRLIMSVDSQRNADDSKLISDYTPDIRFEAYESAIEEKKRLFELSVGVSPGVISRAMGEGNYQNVDNVRKTSMKTQSFINSHRKYCEETLDDLVYTWDVLANYFGIVPYGPYTVAFDWSDDYINTFSDQMAGYVTGESMGATDAVDYRSWFLNETPEESAARVADIKSRKALAAGTDLIDDDVA